MGKKLTGMFPPIVTPFDASGDVAHDKLAQNIAQLCKTPLAGFVVLGTNGEFVYLDEQEKLDVLKTARQAIPKDRVFIAGTGCESTRSTLALTEKAAAIKTSQVSSANGSVRKTIFSGGRYMAMT